MTSKYGKLIRRSVNLLFAVPLIFITACSEKGGNQPAQKEPSLNPKHVKVMQIEAQPYQEKVINVGSLCAGLKVNLATEMGGIIERLNFDRGQKVKKGRVLAEIGTESIRIEVRQAKAALAVAESNLNKLERGNRPEEIRIAKASVEKAKASLSEAENNFTRIKDLYKIKAVSSSDYDSAKMVLETARAGLESAKQQLALSEEGPRREDIEAASANLEQASASHAMAKDRLRKSILRSPSDGVIAFRNIEEGEVVGPGTIITQIVDAKQLKIKVSLGERYINVLERQKQFNFTVDALPGEKFKCRLTFRSPSADSTTRSFPLEFLVDEPDPRMADGMTVRVIFSLLNPKKSIKVPSAWLSEEKGLIGLFVVEDGKARFRPVTLGSYYGHKVEILSGVKVQELAITNPGGLKSGDKITYR